MKKRLLTCRLLAMLLIPTAMLVPARAGYTDAPAGIFLVPAIQEEAVDHDWAYRKKVLIETAVSAGSGTGTQTAGSTGSGKTLMVMHQLKRLAGEDQFARSVASLSSVPQTSIIGWAAVRTVFEKETGKDLGWFFKQWTERSGLPDLAVENGRYRENSGRYEVLFDLVQHEDIYLLDVPVVITLLRGGVKRESVSLDSAKKQVSLFVGDEPGSISVDPDYDIPRKPTRSETPPLCGRLLSDNKRLLVLPAGGNSFYERFVAEWGKRFTVRAASDVRDADLRESSLLILGKDNPVVQRLYGRIEPTAGTLLLAKRNPWNEEKVVVIATAGSATEAEEAFRRLDAPEEASSVALDGRGAVIRRIAESERGMNMELGTEPPAIDTSAIKTLTQVIEAASGKQIIYVGELHDRVSHHAVQLRVIKALFEKNPNIAIGMEMFQRPFQGVLDEYIKGSIDEREFLKKTEYFRRWIFDYNLYKPILDFARREGIPVVALNQRKEITEKVSRDGLDSLTVEERKDVPAETDFSDTAYRDRLKQTFSEHKNNGERNFEYFYQAQVLWDETMAMSIDDYVRKNPDRRLVVLAGAGHLAYGSGISKRAFRRNGLSYATIVNDMDVDRDMADFLVYPQPLEGVAAPRLMVVLKEGDGRVAVANLAENSVSGKAGIRPGDTILSIDGEPVHSVEDVKRELFFKTNRSSFKVRVLRKRFLLSDREIEFEVNAT